MPEPRRNILEVAHLTTGYGRVEVLRDVSIEVGEGEVVTLIGANGAGKSTLLSCVAGLLPPWSGSIRLKGEEIGGACRPRSWWARVSRSFPRAGVSLAT